MKRRSGSCRREGDLNTDGLDIDPDDLAEVLRVDPDGIRAQLPQVKEHLAKFGDALPAEIHQQLDALQQRLA